MTRLQTYIILVILSLMAWIALFNLVAGNSRQQCETIASSDVCAWELR